MVFTADQACAGVRVRMVASPGRVVPTSPSDGEIVLDTMLTLRPGVPEEKKVTVPRKTVWVRCFVVAGQAVKTDYTGTGKAMRQFAVRRGQRFAKQTANTPQLDAWCVLFDAEANTLSVVTADPTPPHSATVRRHPNRSPTPARRQTRP